MSRRAAGVERLLEQGDACLCSESLTEDRSGQDRSHHGLEHVVHARELICIDLKVIGAP